MFVTKKKYNKLLEHHEVLSTEVKYLKNEFYDFKDTLNANGVATSINKLNDEVFKDIKKRPEVHIWSGFDSMFGYNEEPSLKGKVDAIIEHLKLNIDIKSESKKIKASKKAEKKKK